MKRILVYLLIAVLFCSNLIGYELLDMNYPAPFTGVLLDEQEVTDYFNQTHDVEASKFEVNTLQQELAYKEQMVEDCKAHYRNILYFSTGSMVFGIAITIGLVYILEGK